jgi:uncharacterized protein YcbX
VPDLSLSSLHVHPVKSCRGFSPVRWPLDRFGLSHDRSFMVVDEGGRGLTQREHPALATVETRIDGERLHLSAPGGKALALPVAAPTAPRREIRVWRHVGAGLDRGEEAAALFSDLLGLSCRLVSVPPDHARRVNPERFPGEAHTAFSDGYPLLVISEASLEALNRKLPSPLPMDRFRPNLVVAGCAPFAEDGWKRIRIGDTVLEIVKPCDRCVVTTTDQETGLRAGKEPLRTLATFRQREGAVFFGQNAVHLGSGALETGMPVEVLETQTPLFPADGPSAR